MSENTERETLEKLRAGDLRAFEETVLKYERAIWNHLRRLTGNVDDATDLTQDTFLKLFRNRGTVDPSLNFKNWLYRVATNTAYDFLRKKGRLPASDTSEDDEENETIPPHQAYSIQEAQTTVLDVRAALEKIPPHHQAILFLYYRDGFSYEEIAEVYEMNVNTVKTNLRRAKIALRVHLPEYEKQ